MDSRRNRPTAATPPGYFGAFEGDRIPQRSDYKLACRAIKGRWGIPQRTRDVIRAHALATVRDSQAPVALKCSALRFILIAENLTLEAVVKKYNLTPKQFGG
jgi:hypothetical protein